MTENKIFLQQKLKLRLSTNIKHEIRLLSEVIKKKDVVFHFFKHVKQDSNPGLLRSSL
jgi:hypothetical protein